MVNLLKIYGVRDFVGLTEFAQVKYFVSAKRSGSPITTVIVVVASA